MDISIAISKLAGKVSAPTSKSMAHRALICAALSDGESGLIGIQESMDILATINCLEKLGATFTKDGDMLKVRGFRDNPLSSLALDCHESGSTIRFLVPLCLLNNQKYKLTGAKRLLERPMDIYQDLAKTHNFEFKQTDNELTVKGKLASGKYSLKGDVSSQFISGLLFVLPILDGDSVISFTTKVESRSYINLTIKSLADFGVKIDWDGDNLIVKGNQIYSSRELVVEKDYSNGAFFEAINYLGGDVVVDGLTNDSLQGDKVYLDYFPLLASGHPILDLADCPDLGPILFVVAAVNNGATFINTQRLKIKESDRGACMAEELIKFGVKVEIFENKIIVHQTKIKKPQEIINTHNDHRLVMSLSILLSLTGGIISNIQAVNKSFPNFFELMETLGLKVTNEN